MKKLLSIILTAFLVLISIPAFALTPEEAKTIYKANHCKMASQTTDQICYICDPTPAPECGSPIDINVTVHWNPEWDTEEPLPEVPFIYVPDETGKIVIPAMGYEENTGWVEQAPVLLSPENGISHGEDTTGLLATYRIQLESGAYYIWAKGNNPGGSSDSVSYGIDGTRIDSLTFLNKTWTNESQYTGGRCILSGEGEHLLDIWEREDGVQFEEIILTKDQNFKP